MGLKSGASLPIAVAMGPFSPEERGKGLAFPTFFPLSFGEKGPAARSFSEGWWEERPTQRNMPSKSCGGVLEALSRLLFQQQHTQTAGKDHADPNNTKGVWVFAEECCTGDHCKNCE
jgi:hypothetical protein